MSATSNAPSSEYLQHHPVEPPRIDGREFRPAWRRRDRLDELLARGVIGLAEWRAGIGLRELHERAVADSLRAKDLAAVRLDRHCRRRSAPELTERQATALARLRVIETTLGALFTLAVWAIVDELPWAEIARRLDVDPQTARVWTLAALAGLAACPQLSREPPPAGPRTAPGAPHPAPATSTGSVSGHRRREPPAPPDRVPPAILPAQPANGRAQRP